MMAEGHEFKTAFIMQYGTFEWLVLPLVYLDDLLVYSESLA